MRECPTNAFTCRQLCWRSIGASLDKLIGMAHKEPVLVLTFDGEEFIFSQADDLDRNVESLRNSQTFQKFLEDRKQYSSKFKK